ncbi:hypothetical protein BaRGS_00006002 [Batillaria attramentaria]|uniref:Uncharacterized protein n=1 Tax=Batillaria attramentaria TaxID=370345 RepID=A0ABD0LV03_9CAEN
MTPRESKHVVFDHLHRWQPHGHTHLIISSKPNTQYTVRPWSSNPVGCCRMLLSQSPRRMSPKPDHRVHLSCAGLKYIRCTAELYAEDTAQDNVSGRDCT